MAFDDIGHGILAQPHLAPDQAVAAFLCDKSQDFRRQAVGFWPLPRLAAQLLAARLCRGDTGADALLDQLTLELGGYDPELRPELLVLRPLKVRVNGAV